jgi:hypothetical protein
VDSTEGPNHRSEEPGREKGVLRPVAHTVAYEHLALLAEQL